MAAELFPIAEAACRCDVDALREIFSAGVHVDHTHSGRSFTALQLVCKAWRKKIEAYPFIKTFTEQDRAACVKFLLAKGASPNAGAPGNPGQGDGDTDNYTPLMSAAFKANIEVVRMLLSAGSDVNVICTTRDINGEYHDTALTSAVFSYFDSPQNPVRECDAVLEAILRAGADPNPPADLGMTIMELAIIYGGRRIWPLLLRGGSILPTREQDHPMHGYDTNRAHPYLQKLDAAGGFKAYEKAHRTKLLATFTPKFTHLVPPELVPIIVEFSFHVGFY